MLRNLLLAFCLNGILMAGIDLRLPTANNHLLTDEPEQFYMYVQRTFEGEVTTPWEGGGFGIVRNPIRINNQIVLTKFHEGIDIKPVNRDAAGNPLDPVSSIADGCVVHISPQAGRSNYGKYVVIEHVWENSSVYSLYAHLADITCKPGDTVKAGDVIGRMGFTGEGIDRTRAHVHLELTFLLSRYFNDYQKSASKGDTNYHGIYNGLNLTGIDVAKFFLMHKANPELRFSEFIASLPVYFKVTVPSKGVTPDFVTRYPWICHGNPEGAVSWEISFTATGEPLAFTPSDRKVDAPVVTSVRPSKIPQRYLTHNLLSGQDDHATLTSHGKLLIALITDDFPITKDQVADPQLPTPKG